MEPNEESQETPVTTEENGAAATDSPKERNDSSDQVTETKATIKIEGQEFELDSSLAQDDKTLTVVLQPHFASIENANITREIKDGKLTVTIVKKAQHKGHR